MREKWKKPQKEQLRRDPCPRMDRPAMDVMFTKHVLPDHPGTSNSGQEISCLIILKLKGSNV